MKIAIALLLSTLSMLAQAANVGDNLKPWTLPDQYDQPYTLNEKTKILLVARNMDGAKLVKEVLKDQPKGYLEARDAVFVADIQRMPRLIAKLFAVPAMQAYNYRVMLDREARITPRYPGAVDKVLWLQLDKGQLIEQREYASATELRQALEQVKP